MSVVGAKRVNMEKLHQGEKLAYVCSWSKAGRFGEVAPNRKIRLALELE